MKSSCGPRAPPTKTTIIIVVLAAMILTFACSRVVFSFTPEEEAVFEKAKKSLDVHQNQSSTPPFTPGSIGSNFVQTANKTVSGGLLLSNTFSFYDSLGTFHVTGEVSNRSPDAMQSVSAVATFFDSAKNVVGTTTGYGYPPVLNPGIKGAFEITGPDSTQSKKISSFKVTLDGDLATIKPAALKLRVGNHYLGQFGFYKVAGDITNTGADPSSSTEVDGIFYNKLGKVIAISLTYPPQTDLDPGQASPYELTAFALGSQKITSFKLFADSSEYTSNAAR